MRQVALVSAGAEGEAAAAWLAAEPGLSAVRCPSLHDVHLSRTELLWVHAVAADPTATLLPWLRGGGRLLLTLDAVGLPSRLGLEPVAPDDRCEAVWRHADDEFWLDEYRSFLAFPHVRGLAAYGVHPLFHGLAQGTYTWAPSEGEPYRWLTYRSARPAAGQGVAAERSFIHLNAERLVAWEQEVGEGGILCLGAYIHLAAPDPLLARQLRAMLRNAVAGDAIPHSTRQGTAVCWPGDREEVDGETAIAAPEPLAEVWDEWTPSSSPLFIEDNGREDAPWTFAGRRLVVTGSGAHGILEAWLHPWRILRDAEVLVAGRRAEVVAVRVAPDEIVRTLRAGEIELTERLTTALDHGLLFWSLVADAQSPLSLTWTSDFRRMWPYPARPGQEMRLVAGTPSPGEVPRVIRGGPASDPPRLEVQCHAGGIAASAGERGVHWVARGDGLLRLVLAAGIDDNDLARSLDALQRRKLRAFRQDRVLHARRLHERLTTIESPEPALDRAVEWAKVRMDAFLGETPGVGRSLLAGYATSRPGWGDGRPGYGWYFGRDACWTAFATLAMGDREIAKDTLRFLSRTQDVSGKVLHEYTTSGLAHYDAADSTPLYLLLAGRYAAWTGDLGWLERQWSSIEAAYRFCLETDTDGDGLIENSRVGHGWIEHGPLGGLHVTLYLAACWLAALEALAPVARALGRASLADDLVSRAATARAAIARRFRTGDGWALGLEADGTPRAHRTAMLSVPLLLGAIPADSADAWFDAIAGEGFSAPWGVRMLSKDDPLFDPEGYHLGAVWPLFTGWVSLAEWRAGRWEAAFGHLRANAALAGERAKGAFDEVLHGTERRAAGICPDQAWSAAMVVSPVVEGLWGVVPDALAQGVSIAPWLPPGWSEMALRRLRVGPTTLDLRLRRRHGCLILRVARVQGPAIRLGATSRSREALTGITLNDEPLGGRRAVFEVGEQDEVVFHLG